VPDVLQVKPVGQVPQRPASTTPPLDDPLDEPELLPEPDPLLEPLDEPELLPELEPLDEPLLLDPLLEPLDDEPPPSLPGLAGVLPELLHAAMIAAVTAHERRAWTRMAEAYHDEGVRLGGSRIAVRSRLGLDVSRPWVRERVEVPRCRRRCRRSSPRARP
jgi:hypothetical protein